MDTISLGKVVITWDEFVAMHQTLYMWVGRGAQYNHNYRYSIATIRNIILASFPGLLTIQFCIVEPTKNWMTGRPRIKASIILGQA